MLPHPPHAMARVYLALPAATLLACAPITGHRTEMDSETRSCMEQRRATGPALHTCKSWTPSLDERVWCADFLGLHDGERVKVTMKSTRSGEHLTVEVLVREMTSSVVTLDFEQRDGGVQLLSVRRSTYWDDGPDVSEDEFTSGWISVPLEPWSIGAPWAVRGALIESGGNELDTVMFEVSAVVTP